MAQANENDTKNEKPVAHEGSDFARGQRGDEEVTPPEEEGGDFAAGMETQPHQQGHPDFARGERTMPDTDEGESDFARGQRTE